MIKITLSGREDLSKKIQKLNEANKKMPTLTNLAIQKFAFAVLKDAKDKYILKTGVTTPENIASRTGRLRSSIHAQFKNAEDSTDIFIGTNVKYAAIHEYGGFTGRKGTVKIPKRPYIKPAIDANFPKLDEELNQIYKRYPSI